MKKIVSLFLCMILAFSVLTCAASAETTSMSVEDFSYVAPTTTTTEPDTELESFIEDFLGDNLRDKTDEAVGLIKFMRSFFESIVKFFKDLGDYISSLGNRAVERIFKRSKAQ